MALPAERLKTLIEAALFVAGRPLNVSELKSSVLADYPVTSRYVQLLLAELRQDYSSSGESSSRRSPPAGASRRARSMPRSCRACGANGRPAIRAPCWKP